MDSSFDTAQLYDTLERRYGLLNPGIEVFGPEDSLPRPAIALFHGCGGLRPFIRHYAEAAAAKGWRAFVVDSFGPRGWGRTFNLSFVCTGMVFQGYERAGDILAVLWGLKQRADVRSDTVVLAGFSHGGWAITDLMTLRLNRPGEARIADPDPSLLAGVKGLFLVYPYLGFPARSVAQDWHYAPQVKAVLAGRDHLTSVEHARRIFNRLNATGVPTDTLVLPEATHAFDESPAAAFSPMHFDQWAFDQSTAAMQDLLVRLDTPLKAQSPRAQASANRKRASASG